MSGGLKRILPVIKQWRWRAARRWLALPLLALPLACHSGAETEARRQTTTLAQALRPAFFAEALRRAGGAHYHGTARFAAGLAKPDDGVTTTTDVWIDGAHNFRLAETNDRDGGREVVRAGRELFVALRYGKMIRRVAEEPEPTRLLEEALGAPWAAWEIAAPWASLERSAPASGVTEYRLSRAAARVEAAAEPEKAMRAWRSGVVVDQLSGRALVDEATGALRQVDLSATFTTKREGRDLKGSLEVHGTLADVGHTAAVTAPPAEDLPLRQRTVPEQRELLGRLPSTRLPPAAPAKPSQAKPSQAKPSQAKPSQTNELKKGSAP